jgi:hypothetical protein
MATDLEQLVVQMSADFKAYERAFAKAAGVTKDQLNQVKTGAQQMGNVVEGNFNRAGVSAERMQRRFRAGFVNVSNQLQDFTVQVASGTSAVRAFSQQAPQLLTVFGPVGAAVGIAAATIPLLVAALKGMGGSSVDVSENVKGLEQSLKDLAAAGIETAKATDIFTASLQNLATSGARAQIEAVRTQMRELLKDRQEAVPLLAPGREQFSVDPAQIGAQQTVIDHITDMANKLQISTEQAARLADAMQRVADATDDQLVGRYQDLANLLAAIATTADAKAKPALTDMHAEVVGAGQAAKTLWDNTNGAAVAAGALTASWMKVLAAAQGAEMASGRAIAAAARVSSEQQRINDSRVPVNPATLPGGFTVTGVPASVSDPFRNLGTVITPAQPTVRGGGGGGGGGIDKAAKDAQRNLELMERISQHHHDLVTQAIEDVQKQNEATAQSFADIVINAKGVGDVLNDLVKMLERIVLTKAFEQIFAGAGNPTSLLGSVFPGMFHSGGVAGQGGYVGRGVSPAAFIGAPRYHSGGIAGLRPGEVPAILKQGETVTPAGMGGVVVNVHNAPVGTQVEQKTGAGGTKQIEIFIRDKVRGLLSEGSLDREMRTSFGVARRARGL